jgi:hypothetical protein
LCVVYEPDKRFILIGDGEDGHLAGADDGMMGLLFEEEERGGDDVCVVFLPS